MRRAAQRPYRRGNPQGDESWPPHAASGRTESYRPAAHSTFVPYAQAAPQRGCDHLALVAFAADGTPLGVVRAIRQRDDAAAAEVALAIIDARQRQGLGTELISRLARCAAAAGIERLVAQVLAETGLATS